MNRVLIGVVFLLACLGLEAQMAEYCGTRGTHTEWENYLKEHKGVITRTNNCNVFVPLTVHIVGEDNGTGYHPLNLVLGSIEQLNVDFEASGIKFFLGSPINYINKSSWYEHESFGTGAQMMNANNVPNTVNCYIVNNPADNCGYRSFNGDAIALAKSCTQLDDHTWAHEMGHWLSLPHTFFGWEGVDYNDEEDTPTSVGSRQVEKVDGSNCSSAADRICDTPVDYLSFRWGCDDNNEYPDSLKDPDGVRFAVDGTYFMSYAFDNCQNRFSGGQIEEMCTYLQNFVPEVVSNASPSDPVDPGQTNLIYPIGGEIVEGAVQLRWEEEGNATFYYVEVSLFSNMAITSVRELVYGTSLDVFGLAQDRKYYWRVRPFNAYDFDYAKTTKTESFETGELSSTDDYYAENLRIFPNPLRQGTQLNIDLYSENSEEITLQFIDMSGRVVLSDRYFVKSGSNRIEIDASKLPSSMYVLRGVGELHNFQKKMVIE